MLIEIRRFKCGGSGTLGTLFIDGVFECFTLEDPPKDYSKFSKGSISTGTYHLELRTVGGMHHRYKRKFNEHRGMLWLRGVPDFRFVYIHIGNNVEDTEGCILVGTCAQSMDGRDRILHSTVAYRKLCRFVSAAIEATNDVRIKITEV